MRWCFYQLLIVCLSFVPVERPRSDKINDMFDWLDKTNMKVDWYDEERKKFYYLDTSDEHGPVFRASRNITEGQVIFGILYSAVINADLILRGMSPILEHIRKTIPRKDFVDIFVQEVKGKVAILATYLLSLKIYGPENIPTYAQVMDALNEFWYLYVRCLPHEIFDPENLSKPPYFDDVFINVPKRMKDDKAKKLFNKFSLLIAQAMASLADNGDETMASWIEPASIKSGNVIDNIIHHSGVLWAIHSVKSRAFYPSNPMLVPQVDMMNHRFDPNCKPQLYDQDSPLSPNMPDGAPWPAEPYTAIEAVIAIKNITKGDELTIAYHSSGADKMSFYYTYGFWPSEWD